MPLYIKDETANSLLLTIDDTGLIAFGNGTPVSQITVNGTAVIDSDGLITNQRAASNAVAPASGVVSVPPGGVVTVTTTPGVVPTVQLDAYWPNVATQHITGPPDRCVSTLIYTSPTHKVLGAQVGQFNVINMTQPDDTGLCSTGIPDSVTYRWM